MPGTVFLQGIVLGVSIAAPVGPIGVLCIRRSIAEGRWVGLLSGLGAATADGLYGCVAGFGMTAVSEFLLDQRLWLTRLGGAYLLLLGVRTLVAPAARDAAMVSARGIAGAYGSTFVLTLTNPMTILSFVAIFAALGPSLGGGGNGAAGALVAGVFLGSASWWMVLSWAASLLRARLESGGLRWINLVSGLVIVAFGVVALVQGGRS
jgi:threonine/homoserine/homoserine lactone efflux protein